MEDQKSDRMRTVLVLALIVAVGLALRLFRLTQESLWIDEMVSWWHAELSGIRGMMKTIALNDTNPPLYYVVFRQWVRLVGTGEFTMRLLSVIFGTLTLPLVFALGKRHMGSRAALIGAGLLAIAPLHIYYSQEIRMYSLLVLLVLGSFLAFDHLLRGRPRVVTAVLYIACTSLALYTHYYALFVIPIQNLWGIISGRWQSRSFLIWWAVTQAAVIISFLPWVGYLTRATPEHTSQGAAALQFLAYPLLLPFHLWSLNGWYQPSMKIIRTPGFAVFAASLLALLAIELLRRRVPTSEDQPAGTHSRWFLFVPVAVVPTMVLLSGAVLGAPEYSIRGLIWLLPIICLLIAAGLDRVFVLAWRWIHTRSAIGFAAVIAPLLAVGIMLAPIQGLSKLYSGTQHEDWRGAANTVLTGFQEGDLVVFPQSFYHIAFDYYAGKHALEPEWSVQLKDGKVVPDPQMDQYRRFWVLNRAGQPIVEKYIESIGATLSKTESHGLVKLSLYSRP